MSKALLNSVPITVRNLGGIDFAELSLHQGVNVFFGENASNRSSLFSAIAGALGARVPTPKTDSHSSLVRLEYDGSEYTVEIDRSDGSQQVTAHTLTARTALCDHFVRLLEDNPLRQSVQRMDGAELYDLLMEPVDTADIEAQIDRAKAERERVDKQLSHYDDLESRLPSLRTSRQQLREELDEIVDEIESVQSALDAQSQPASRADDEQFTELESKREQYRALTATLETQQQALDSLEDERRAVADELAAQTGDDEIDSIEELSDRIDSKRARSRQLANTIQLLQTVIEAGRKTTQQSPDLFESVDTDHNHDTETGHLTDSLTASTETTTCLTCGSTVSPEAIADQITELQSITAEKRDEKEAIESELSSLESTRDRLKDEREQLESLRQRADRLDGEIDETESTVASLRADRADLEVEIDALENAVAQHERDEDSAYQELQRQLTDLEVDRSRVEGRLEDVTAEVTEIEGAIANRDELEARRATLTRRLTELRDRIYDIERETVDTINRVMDEVISELAFENISRVWVERHVETDNHKARADGFDLHIVRTTDDGAAYEDTVGTLSTSEREIIGIVLGVAGYIVHDVNESVPFLLLDAIESIDANRTAILLSYLSDHADYLLATAHPKDRDAFSESVRSLDIKTVLTDSHSE